ncbi:unnamed protein product, partial [Discosporangium mesarthrocarpum]
PIPVAYLLLTYLPCAVYTNSMVAGSHNLLLNTGAPSSVKYVITPEIYDTRYRAVGMGSASVWTRVAG